MKACSLVAALALALVGCGEGLGPDDLGEELELGAAEQELTADRLNLVMLDNDVATGTFSGSLQRLLTDAASARALLGSSTPTGITYSRNWLIAYRPASKTATSRVVLTRAQLSATGQTLSVWATITEPGAGCAPWMPNEIALGRIPARTTKPTSVRVYLTREVSACGLVQGGACTPGVTQCPTATPACHGALPLPDGSYLPGTCTLYPPYALGSATCHSDQDCGGGICALLSMGTEGMCQAPWMRGTYSTPESGTLSVPLSAGAWSRLVVRVAGQASVPMDAWVQVFADGTTPSRVEWRLTNPMGTTSAVGRSKAFGAHVPVGVPGDESINGEWILEVRDTGFGRGAVLRGARLSFTSRWD